MAIVNVFGTNITIEHGVCRCEIPEMAETASRIAQEEVPTYLAGGAKRDNWIAQAIAEKLKGHVISEDPETDSELEMTLIH